MEKFNKIISELTPLKIQNIDTDQIIPARFLKAVSREGFGKNLFRDWRYDSNNEPIKDFVLNNHNKDSKILIAGRNFGCGSSREHAAMEPRFMGCKIILAKSFARIAQTNLQKQGIIPLIFENESDYDLIEAFDTISTVNLKEFKSGNNIKLSLKKPDGSIHTINTLHTFSNNQVSWFKAGSALNLIANQS